jgi:hypothetical protein
MSVPGPVPGGFEGSPGNLEYLGQEMSET